MSKDHINSRKLWSKIPTSIYGNVMKYIENGNFEFVDNIRIAELGNEESEQRYEELKDMGCCGFEDYIYVPFDLKGRKYYFGFNHGH
jgi:hypothetical protein